MGRWTATRCRLLRPTVPRWRIPSLRRAALEAAASALQASLDLTDGPIMRAALFDYGTGQPDRLLLIIHHLAVDAVSWRILLEDLQTAYTQLCLGEVMQLPPKT